MFNFKEMNITDITLIGNTINVKTNYPEIREPKCSLCGSSLVKIDTINKFCYDKPINGRYVKVEYPVRVYHCHICDEDSEADAPEEVGYYLTRDYFKKITELLETDENINAAKLSEITGLSPEDAELLITIILFNNMVY